MSSWSWLYGSWNYNYLCNQCLSPLKLWVRTLLTWQDVLDTTLCDKVCQWLATGRWFSSGTPVSSTNKTDCHDIAEILLKSSVQHHKTSPGKVCGLLILADWSSLLQTSSIFKGILRSSCLVRVLHLCTLGKGSWLILRSSCSVRVLHLCTLGKEVDLYLDLAAQWEFSTCVP